jgi:hypothetical protein
MYTLKYISNQFVLSHTHTVALLKMYVADNWINVKMYIVNNDVNFHLATINAFIVNVNAQCSIIMNTYGYVIVITALLMYAIHRSFAQRAKATTATAIASQQVKVCKTYSEEGTQTYKEYIGVMTRSKWN